MILGPITHAGRQWQTLCEACGLDPDMATAADITATIRRRVNVSANRDLVTACGAAEEYVSSHPPLPGEYDRWAMVLQQLAAALDAALGRGD